MVALQLCKLEDLPIEIRLCACIRKTGDDFLKPLPGDALHPDRFDFGSQVGHRKLVDGQLLEEAGPLVLFFCAVVRVEETCDGILEAGQLATQLLVLLIFRCRLEIRSSCPALLLHRLEMGVAAPDLPDPDSLLIDTIALPAAKMPVKPTGECCGCFIPHIVKLRSEKVLDRFRAAVTGDHRSRRI